METMDMEFGRSISREEEVSDVAKQAVTKMEGNRSYRQDFTHTLMALSSCYILSRDVDSCLNLLKITGLRPHGRFIISKWRLRTQ